MEMLATISFILSILVLPITYLLGRTIVDTRMNKEEIDDLHERIVSLQREMLQREIDRYENK